MINREDLFNVLQYLVPDSKFSFWPEGAHDWVRTIPIKKYKKEMRKCTCLKYKDVTENIKCVNEKNEPIYDENGKQKVIVITKQVAYFVDEDQEFTIEYFEDTEIRGTADMGCENEIKMDGWVIDWKNSNNVPCPTLDQIKAIDMAVVNADVKKREKLFRNYTKAKDLSIIAAYNSSLVINPKLTFSDYLDSLEKLSEDLQKSQEVTKA